MKTNLFFLLAFLFTISTFGQTKLYDNVFIKAEDISTYDKFIKEHYAKIHNERVDKGILIQWDVWKVIDTPQEDFPCNCQMFVFTGSYSTSLDLRDPK